MQLNGKKLVGMYSREDNLWVAKLTWRLGFKGPYLVRGGDERELREKVQRLDPTVKFYARGSSRFWKAQTNESE